MSKKLSVEEALRQKLNELPLPDETGSWQKMKALLDEKEKRKPFVFVPYQKMIGGVILLSLLCLWLVISPEKTRKQTAMADAKNNAIKEEHFPQDQVTGTTSDHALTKKKKIAGKDSSLSLLSNKKETISRTTNAPEQNLTFNKNRLITATKKQPATRKKLSLIAKANSIQSLQKHNVKGNENSDVPIANNDGRLSDSVADQSQVSISHNSTVRGMNTDSSRQVGVITKTDDNNNKTSFAKDSLQRQTDSAATTATKANIIIRHRNPYFIDGGIGIKQSLPVSGQKFVSYNDTMNKTWLSDYIPFAYIRLEKKGRWFVQGEFHYASPRLVKAFTYYQKTTPDYNHGSTTTEAYRLQKTWYLQVPLSLNLYLRPHLSAGAGAVYNRLNSALSNKEIGFNDYIAGTGFIGAQTLPVAHFSDSFLYKTNTSLLLQTDYQKERWSVGLRYMQDLQPYLRYTLPDGEKKDKRNTSLELMIRYRFYRSAAFRLGKR